MPTAKELRDQKATLAEQAKAILDRAAEENQRDLTPEEVESFDAIHDDIEAKTKQLQRFERQERVEADLNEIQERRTDSSASRERAEEESEKRSRQRTGAMPNAAEGMRAWLMAGSDQTPTAEQVSAARAVGIDPFSKRMSFRFAPKAPRTVQEARELEFRQQAVGTDAKGGYTVPDDTMRDLEEALLQFGGMRQVANVIRTERGSDLPIPTVNETTQKGKILAENTQASTADMTFNQVVLGSYKYTSDIVLVSLELLQDNAVNLSNYIGRAVGERIARILNEHFTTGSGSGEPEGIVTGSTTGVTAASETAITYGELVDLQHSVDPAYRNPNGTWMFSDAQLKAVKKLTDGDSRPIWSSGIAVREPDTILGHPYVVNNEMATPAAEAVSVLFGDLSKYMIRDVMDISLLRLDERYADFGQVAFLAFSRHDGALIDAGTNPVKHLAQAAATT